jgi:hypothetical protein
MGREWEEKRSRNLLVCLKSVPISVSIVGSRKMRSSNGMGMEWPADGHHPKNILMAKKVNGCKRWARLFVSQLLCPLSAGSAAVHFDG